MSDSGFTKEDRAPSTWSHQEMHNYLRMHIAAVTHPNSTKRHVALTVSEATAIVDTYQRCFLDAEASAPVALRASARRSETQEPPKDRGRARTTALDR